MFDGVKAKDPEALRLYKRNKTKNLLQFKRTVNIFNKDLFI